MDLSEKDASRSKWKLSQRHRQGRRGRGVPSAGRTSRLSKQLESNESRYCTQSIHTDGIASCLSTCGVLGGSATGCRYVEPEADEHAGPVRKSQGADLAELLEGTDVIDVAFYQRARVNLVEDYGLPPSHGRTFHVRLAAKGCVAQTSCSLRYQSAGYPDAASDAAIGAFGAVVSPLCMVAAGASRMWGHQSSAGLDAQTYQAHI